MGYSFNSMKPNVPDDVLVFKFDIRLDHLGEGVPCEPMLCPIALALSELGFYHVTVEHEVISYCLTSNSEDRLVHVASDVMDWQRDFDFDKDPGPISLVLLQHKDPLQGDRLFSLEGFQRLNLG